MSTRPIKARPATSDVARARKRKRKASACPRCLAIGRIPHCLACAMRRAGK